MKRRTLLVPFVLAGAFVVGSFSGATAQERLRFDRPSRAEIDWREETWVTFVVDVPRDAIVLHLVVEDAPVDLDLYARLGEPMADWTEADHAADSTRYNDELRLSRYDDPPLQSGRYFVDVAYTLGTEPIVGKRRLKRIPFTIRAEVIRARVDAEIEPDTRIASETTRETGYFRTFVIDVPAGTEALRIDLDEVGHDMDIIARHGRQIIDADDADHEALTYRGRETLLIDTTTRPPIAPGRWFINVFDAYQTGHVSFALYARFDASPPEALLAIPAMPEARDRMEHAVLATVEISGEDGSGSGTLLSADGLILTNYHVIETAGGGVPDGDQLIVSVNLDPRQPPFELFRARVVLAEESLDLALVEITSGLYGQPLPEGYRFPFLEIGDPDSLRIGTPISVLGFPAAGGTGSRTSVTFTRGVISGFEASDIGIILKTDADISSGNSGGAALDEEFRLVGVPTFVVPEVDGNAQMGYLHPVSLMPEDWRQRIAARR